MKTTSWCHISLLHWNEIPACFEFPHVKISLLHLFILTNTLIQCDLQAQPGLIQTQAVKKNKKQKLMSG